MTKWKLLLTSLPIVLAILGLKLFLTEYLHFKGLMELSEMGMILTGGIFLMGFMLAGTMADYKESEKIPAEIAASCENIEETFALVTFKSGKDGAVYKEVKSSLLQLFDDVDSWITLKIGRKEIFPKLDRFRATMLLVENEIAANAYFKIMNELQTLRKSINRVNVISITGFISTGYALLEMILTLIGLLLMITTFKNLMAEIVIVFFISLVYLYMYRLIRDIDDPFEYEEGKVGATEITLFPLQDFFARAKERLTK